MFAIIAKPFSDLFRILPGVRRSLPEHVFLEYTGCCWGRSIRLGLKPLDKLWCFSRNKLCRGCVWEDYQDRELTCSSRCHPQYGLRCAVNLRSSLENPDYCRVKIYLESYVSVHYPHKLLQRMYQSRYQFRDFQFLL